MSTSEPSFTPEATSARGVVHAYGEVEALDGVDCVLERGRVTALLGPNGSGKTTLLRVLAGVLEADAGEVRVLGRRLPAAAGDLRELRRRVAYVSQSPALDPEMTGRETLVLMAALHGVGRRERGRRVRELADAFGLGDVLGRRLDTWSGGQRRRLHLAAALVHAPELLLLDEPTSGLDEHGRTFLWDELLRRAAGGATVAVVTHDLADVERRAHQALLLDRGRVLASGPPSVIAAEHGGEVTVTMTGLASAFRRLTGREPGAGPQRRRTV